MEDYNKLWRFFFAISLAAIAGQQLFCADFRPVIMTPWPSWMPGRLAATWICSAVLIAAGIALILEIRARTIAITMGVLFLAAVLIFHIPYQASNNLRFLGAWGNAFKALAYSGGCFVVAGSFPDEQSGFRFINLAAKLIPYGKYFFCTTMVVFGFEHFIYPAFVATLVPDWIPGHPFWTYFGGIALILSGLAIAFNIQAHRAAALLGAMIFLWFIMLHIPRAIVDPYSGNGNEWTSVFEALGFSGVAFLLASKQPKGYVQQWELDSI